jgi:hypothetical protein
MATQGKDLATLDLPQRAFKRPAVVHLGADAAGMDSVVLVGSFVTSNTYQAYIDATTANASVSIVQPFEDAEDCLTEFDPDYAFAHLFAPNGQTTDARIQDGTVACNSRPDIPVGCGCQFNLASGELFADGPSAFASGQLVHVAANQAALYTVRPTGNHYALVRYFVDFDSEIGACTSTSLLGKVDQTTIKVIADYVSDFQVWFRNVYSNTSVAAWALPRYWDMSTLSSARMLPCDRAKLFGTAAPGCLADSNHLGCDVVTTGVLGAEQVRSAVIRLAVRTEKTDQEVMKLVKDTVWTTIENRDPSNDANLLLRFSVARPPSDGDNRDVGAYKVRTVVTEVAMPNIAARMASFRDIVNL